MNTKSTDAWVAWGIRNKRSIFFYENKVLDLTDFASIHPGGKRSLECYIYKDITQTLFKVYPHNRQSTLHRLNRYIIGCSESQVGKASEQKIPLSNHKTPGGSTKKKVCFKKKGSHVQCQSSSERKNTNKSRQRSKFREKSQTKKKSHYSASEGKENKKSKFQVSIKIIQSHQDLSDQNIPIAQKTEKLSKRWFEQQFDCEELKQDKDEIRFPAFATKQRQTL